MAAEEKVVALGVVVALEFECGLIPAAFSKRVLGPDLPPAFQSPEKAKGTQSLENKLMTNKRPAGRCDPVPPDCDRERRESILSDVLEMRVERLKLLLWLSERSECEKTTPNFFDAAAIVQRRIDKIEERLSEVGLACDGFERVL